MSGIVASKRLLRREIGNTLKSVSALEVRRQSENVGRILQELPEYKTAQHVAFYAHLDNEVETDVLIEAAFRQHKTVFLPVIRDGSSMSMVRVNSLQDYRNMIPKGKYSIREPEYSEENSALNVGGLDLIVIPGVAFTAKRHRLGHGKGYYDRFIKLYRESMGANKIQRRPFLVAVGLEQQLVTEVPCEDHDEQLDALIINDKLYRGE